MNFKYIAKQDNVYWVFCDNIYPYLTNAYPVQSRDVDTNCIYTIEEVEEYLTEHPEALLDMQAIEQERKIAEIKSRRDSKIQSVIWRIERHESELRQGIVLTEPIEPIDTYIQALRDIPQQAGFPNNIIWPELEGA